MEDLIICSGTCKLYYDFCCAGFSEKNFRKLSKESRSRWKCVTCKTSREPADSESENDFEVTVRNMLKSLSINVDKIDKKLETIESQHSEQLRDLKKSVEFCCSKVDEFNLVVEKVQREQKVLDKLQGDLKRENVELKTRVVVLETRVEDMQQYSRSDNVEIVGVPLTPNEDIFFLLEQLAVAIEVVFDRNHISAAHRIPARDPQKTPSIVVKFVSRQFKQIWMRHANYISCPEGGRPTRRYLLASEIYTKFDKTRVFVHDHLTSYNKKLLFDTKKFAAEKKFDFVWVKDAKIFIKRNTKTNPIRISSFSDLEKL